MYHFFLLRDWYYLSRLSLIINVFWLNGMVGRPFSGTSVQRVKYGKDSGLRRKGRSEKECIFQTRR
jgi:hypothetical protein